jgi:hypothetical protein
VEQSLQSHSGIEPPLGTGAFDEVLDMSTVCPAQDYSYDPSFDSYLPASVREDASLLRAQREAEAAEVLAAPESLSAAMVELSAFPPQAAFRLAARAARRPTSAARPTVADMVRRDYSAYVPPMVLPAPRVSESYQLETQRAYAVLYDELRSGESTSKGRHASAKLAPPPAPQDSSRFLSRFHTRLSSALTSAQQVAAGVAAHGSNVLASAIPYSSSTGRRAAD